jgi:DNA-binding CsgD family transcriptional regulator
MKEIAAQLGVRVKKIETHRPAIRERTGLRTFAALVLFSVREGSIQP